MNSRPALRAARPAPGRPAGRQVSELRSLQARTLARTSFAAATMRCPICTEVTPRNQTSTPPGLPSFKSECRRVAPSWTWAAACDHRHHAGARLVLAGRARSVALAASTVPWRIEQADGLREEVERYSDAERVILADACQALLRYGPLPHPFSPLVSHRFRDPRAGDTYALVLPLCQLGLGMCTAPAHPPQECSARPRPILQRSAEVLPVRPGLCRSRSFSGRWHLPWLVNTFFLPWAAIPPLDGNARIPHSWNGPTWNDPSMPRCNQRRGRWLVRRC
jgi:hypothetical protein